MSVSETPGRSSGPDVARVDTETDTEAASDTASPVGHASSEVTPAMVGEIGIAARNAVKLGVSLFGTWTVTLLVRFQLPRFLGPEVFGSFNFADNFAASFFAFLDLGIDTYIAKEVSVRPKLASEFFGGIVLLRAAIAVVLIAAMTTVLGLTHRPAEIRLAAGFFALTYFVVCINNTLASLLQAATKVGRLAVLNVAGKIVWGVGLAALIWFKQPMARLALPLLASELLRMVLLFPAAREALDLRLRVQMASVKEAFLASLPFFIGGFAINLTPRLTVSLLEFLAHDPREVGWLGAAANLGSLSMIMSPLLGWVVMPMLARARQRSTEDVFAIIRAALEGLLVVSIPISLFIALGADIWVKLAFGQKFAQSALSLVMIAPQFVFTYTAMILSIALVILDKQWIVTRISLTALVLTPIFVLVLVPIASKLGEGWAAAGAAAGVVFSELVVSISSLRHVGYGAVNRRSILAASKSAGLAVCVAGIDHLLRPMGIGRIAIDFVIYVVVAVAIGAIRIGDAVRVFQMISQGRKEAKAVAPA